MLFFRKTTDGNRIDADWLKDSYAGIGQPSKCIILGASPYLNTLPVSVLRDIEQAPVAKFAINYGGRGKDGEGWLIKPTHWTTYDATWQFPKTLLLDPTIQKFVKAGRATDLITDTTDKLCDAPNVYCFETEHRDYEHQFDPDSQKVLDNRDSFAQTLDIAIKLGFREIWLLGCSMQVPVSVEVQEYCKAKEVDHTDLFRIPELIKEKHGINQTKTYEDLEGLDHADQYCMSEKKPISRICSSDRHYWEAVQRLRLSRKSLSRHGVRLVSCTPESRLNTWFEYAPLEDLLGSWDSPKNDSTYGVYGRQNTPPVLPYHKDIGHYRHTEASTVEPEPAKARLRPKTPLHKWIEEGRDLHVE